MFILWCLMLQNRLFIFITYIVQVAQFLATLRSIPAVLSGPYSRPTESCPAFSQALQVRRMPSDW